MQPTLPSKSAITKVVRAIHKAFNKFDMISDEVSGCVADYFYKNVVDGEKYDGDEIYDGNDEKCFKAIVEAIEKKGAKFLGMGRSRIAFSLNDFPDVVVKWEYNGGSDNQKEWERSQELKKEKSRDRKHYLHPYEYTPYKKGKNGSYLLMPYVHVDGNWSSYKKGSYPRSLFDKCPKNFRRQIRQLKFLFSDNHELNIGFQRLEVNGKMKWVPLIIDYAA
jgi:hypothetical protein